MAALTSQQEEKYSLLITGDVDQRSKLMSGIVNGFPQSVELDYQRHFSDTKYYVQVDDRYVQLEVYKFVETPWDSLSSYYRKANGIMILYDVTDEESLDDVFSQWMRPIEHYSYFLEDEYLPTILIGANIEKRDEQKVSMERMRMRAEEISQLKIRFAEVSLVTGENVHTVIQTITRDMIAHRIAKSESELHSKTEPKKKQCVIS